MNPMAILLERLNLQDFDDGLDGLLRQAGAAAQDLLLEEPYWLQVREEWRDCDEDSMKPLLNTCIPPYHRMITTGSAFHQQDSRNAETRLFGI